MVVWKEGDLGLMKPPVDSNKEMNSLGRRLAGPLLATGGLLRGSGTG